MSWQLLDVIPGAHRLFANAKDYPGQIALADESGRTPADCEDGVCLLDTQRPIMAEGDVISAPIILADQGHGESWTPVGVAGALYLADQHRMTIRCETGGYRVVHLNES